MENLYYFAQPAQGDSAIFYYEKAKALNAKDFELYFYLGVSYGNKSDFAKARENLLLAAAIKDDSEVYRYLGISYGMEGNDEMALQYFEKALSLAPDNEQLQQYVAIAKQRMGKL
jgi:tetratricopeptide (TPR) repeat protein